MRTFSRATIAAAIGVIPFSNFGISTATAADVVPEVELRSPPPEYRSAPRYYSQEPVELYREPPVVYAYPQPPSITYYEYAPGPVVVYPRPYYRQGYYGRSYRARGYAPRFARGPARYNYRWDRGHYRR
jgi:hypothetical protein